MKDKVSDNTTTKVQSYSELLQSSLISQKPEYTSLSEGFLSSIIKIGAEKVFNLDKLPKLKKQEERKESFIKITPELSQVKRRPITEILKNTDGEEKQKKRKIPLNIHGRDRIYRVKTDILKDVCIILTNIFEGSSIDMRAFNFSSAQLDLIEAIVLKKFDSDFIKSNLNDTFRNCEKAEKLKRLENYGRFFDSKKRAEENIKFVYKHTLKYLKSQYYENHELKYNKESEIKFYAFYFKATAEELQEPLELFYDPLLLKPGENKQPRTISNAHLRLIFKCEKFKKSFFDYLRSSFKSDYQSSIYKKIERMLFSLENLLGKAGETEREEAIKKYISNINKKKRFKFPWCLNEIDTALAYFVERTKKLKIELIL